MSKRTKPIVSPGKPSSYKKEYCEKIVEFMKEGKTVTQFAAAHYIPRSTIYYWAKHHPEFKEALEMAHEVSQAWWEDAFGDAALGKREGVIPSMMIFKMKQIGWRDRQEVTGEKTVHHVVYSEDEADSVIAEAEEL